MPKRPGRTSAEVLEEERTEQKNQTAKVAHQARLALNPVIKELARLGTYQCCHKCGFVESLGAPDANRWHIISVIYGAVQPLTVETFRFCRDCDDGGVSAFLEAVERKEE